MKETFRKLSKRVSDWTGSPSAFGLATLSIVVWAVSGPLYHYSENWQLVINTSTTIITFLMVFLIQNLQNRDSQMIHLKLDELIRANKRARNDLINLDLRTDEELTKLHLEFCSLKEETDQELKKISKVQHTRKTAERVR